MSKNLTTQEFIEKAKAVHSDTYNYDFVDYINTKSKVVIVCKVHGNFLQSPNKHLSGRICKYCNSILSQEKFRKTVFNKRTVDISKINLPINSRAIPTSRGGYIIVDKEDYDKLIGYNWCLDGYGYAHNRKLGKAHRFIMQETSPLIEIDHINHQVNDNRKINLRACTHSENLKNQKVSNKPTSSKYKGVSWYKNYQKWASAILCDGVKYRLGYFKTEDGAAEAYNSKALELHKDFACLNILK